MNSEAAHLDVGCGKRPRNPFSCSDVHGVDIFAPLPEVIDAEKYKRANVVLEGIPYPALLSISSSISHEY